jgi:hypothetical protein
VGQFGPSNWANSEWRNQFVLATSWEDVSRSSLNIVGNVNRDIKTSPISPGSHYEFNVGHRSRKIVIDFVTSVA